MIGIFHSTSVVLYLHHYMYTLGGSSNLAFKQRGKDIYQMIIDFLR